MSGEGRGPIPGHEGSARSIPTTVCKVRPGRSVAGVGGALSKAPALPETPGARAVGTGHRAQKAPSRATGAPRDTRGEGGGRGADSAARALLREEGGSGRVPPATRGSRGHVCPQSRGPQTRQKESGTARPRAAQPAWAVGRAAAQWGGSAPADPGLLDGAASRGVPSSRPQRPARRRGGAWLPGLAGPAHSTWRRFRGTERSRSFRHDRAARGWSL